MDFFRKQKRSVGIDVSSQGLNSIELIKNKTIEVAGFKSASAVDKTFSHGVIKNHEAMLSVVRELKHATSTKKVYATLPSERAYLFDIEIPATAFKSIERYIKTQLRKHIPFPASHASFGYTTLPTHKKSLKKQAVVYVFPKEVVESYKTLYEESGLSPTFELGARAIARAVIKEGDPSTYLVANVGRHHALLFIVSQSIVRLISTSNFGHSAISTPREYKKNIDTLTEDMRKMYVAWYAQSEKEELPRIRKIILVGRNVNETVANSLSLSLKTPAELGDVWTNILSPTIHIPPIPFVDSLAYAAAIGTALRGLD